MSGLIDTVRADRLQARRERDDARVLALGGLLAALEAAAKDAGGLSDEAGLAVLRRERKRRQEAAESFREGGREADAVREEGEGELIAGYLPPELPAGELEQIVDAAIAEVGATSPRELGAVMKEVMAKGGGQVDGKAASALARARLGG